MKDEKKHRLNTVIMVMSALAMLALVYLFQRNYLFGSLLFPGHPHLAFVFNKTVRLIANDLACFLLIYALFEEKKYLRVAFWVFLFEVLVILPIYFTVKLATEGDSEISSPLLSQVHRLIVNPTLMILLIFGFYYQRWTQQKK